jgi:hypothetical protein
MIRDCCDRRERHAVKSAAFVGWSWQANAARNEVIGGTVVMTRSEGRTKFHRLDRGSRCGERTAYRTCCRLSGGFPRGCENQTPLQQLSVGTAHAQRWKRITLRQKAAQTGKELGQREMLFSPV